MCKKLSQHFLEGLKLATVGAPNVEKENRFLLREVYPPKGDTQHLTRGPIDTLSIYWG